MWPKPVLFISAVSKELHSARDVVAKTLLSLGYESDWEDVFNLEQGDIKAMLRRRVDAADGVIQIIGQCHGCEPPQPDPDFGRVSYTQYESLYARQQRKRVWYLLLDDTFPAAPHDPEPEAVRQLQAAYRERILGDTHLYHSAKDQTELENRIHKLNREFAQFRRRAKKVTALVVGLLLVLVAGGAWLKYGQAKDSEGIAEIKDQNKKLLLAMRDLPAAVAQASQAGDKGGETARLARAYGTLEDKLKLPRGMLEKELPKFAEQLLQRADTRLMDRASALFAVKKFAQAEEAALTAKDKALEAAGKPVKDAIAALGLAGSAAWEQTHYARALDHFRAAAALTSQQRDPVEWAHVQHQLALILQAQGDSRLAADILRQVIEIEERVLGPEHHNTLTSRNNLAIALAAQGKNAEAEKEHRAVLAIRQRVAGPEHPDTLKSRSRLASVLYLHLQGKNAEAEEEHRAVLAIQQRVLGPEHPDTLESRNNLAEILRNQGKNLEAEAEHRAVLGIFLRVLGPEHPNTLGSQNNLACAQAAQGKNAEAEKQHRAILAIRERVLGPEHPDTLKSRHNLASLLCLQGKNAEAEEEHRAVLAIHQRVLGPEHPDTLESRNNLATALYAQAKFSEAEEEDRAVLAIRERVLGPEHRDTLTSRSNLAIALCDQGNYAEAEKQQRAILAIRERVLATEHPDVFITCYSLSLCLKLQGHMPEALVFARRALAGWQKTLGEDHPNTKNAKSLVGYLERPQ
jgi:hypothetical protein